MTESPLTPGAVSGELPDLSTLGLAVRRRQGNGADLTKFCRRCQEFFALVADPAEPARIGIRGLDEPYGARSKRGYVEGALQRSRSSCRTRTLLRALLEARRFRAPRAS